MPSKGLEPPHRCRYMDLNHARLPIPPRWQVDSNRRGSQKPPGQDLHFYSTGENLPVKRLALLWFFGNHGKICCRKR